MSILASFWKREACCQTVLPDRSFLLGQKLVENAKIKKLQMRHFESFSNNVLWISFEILQKLWMILDSNPEPLAQRGSRPQFFVQKFVNWRFYFFYFEFLDIVNFPKLGPPYFSHSKKVAFLPLLKAIIVDYIFCLQGFWRHESFLPFFVFIFSNNDNNNNNNNLNFNDNRRRKRRRKRRFANCSCWFLVPNTFI